jgi:UDP-N-acetyl-D-mannosaminuronic acid transferase (WecB/TagA/CpsF family)
MPDDVGGPPVRAIETIRRGGNSRRILGIDFFTGEPREAIARMRPGGLLVVPAAPALMNLSVDHGYRQALLEADLAITDSAFMVMVWNLLEGDNLRRLSGLEYFSELIGDPEFRRDGSALYVMASAESARTNLAWLESEGIRVQPHQIYIAPIYRDEVKDPVLLERVLSFHPRHVVITVGGGIQERLGLYLKMSLDYLPAIHCIGAAIAFRSGDQVAIPPIADKLSLGWLFRCLWRPRCYVPRYWAARKLAWLLFNYRGQLPPLEVPEEELAARSSSSAA